MDRIKDNEMRAFFAGWQAGREGESSVNNAWTKYREDNPPAYTPLPQDPDEDQWRNKHAG